MVLGFFFVRPLPLPSHGVIAIDVGSPNEYQPLASSADLHEFQHHDSNSAPMRFDSQGDEEGESREPMLQHALRKHGDTPHPPESVELFQSGRNSFQTRDRLDGTSHLTREPPSEKVVEGRGVDLYRWTLWKSIDFWIMGFIHTLCELPLVYFFSAILLTHRSGWYRINV
jgi:hypothetical protein